MREIVLDTETTGFDPASGHRVVEIGCVELINHVPTGQTFHVYLNPERDMPDEAFNVHGLSEEFLSDKPLFAAIAEDFISFIGDAKLVIHNADFDMKFLNWELQMLGHPTMPRDRAIDTVGMARKRFPGSPASLDALCRRFGIDNSARDKHGALLDAELLAHVYLELIGGREPGLALASTRQAAAAAAAQTEVVRVARPARPHAPSEEERARHGDFVAKLTDALWLKA
jgi:DNA polymerase-3 subunit epsilon